MIARPSHRIFILTGLVLLAYLSFDFWKDASATFQSLNYDWEQKEEIAEISSITIDTIARDFLKIKSSNNFPKISSDRTFSLQAKREHYFKTTIISIDSTGITFSGIKWLNGRPDDLKNVSNLKIYDVPLTQSGNFSLVTLGDSQMIWREGRELRKGIAKELPHIKFIGSANDVYGYPTDASMYDSSKKVLMKATKVPKADGYLLFFGAHDKKKDYSEVKERICQIFSEIRRKAPEAKIWYITLPPSNKVDVMAYNKHYNEMLKQCANEITNIKSIELFDALKNEQNFLSEDKIHLNKYGYKILLEQISKALVL